MGKDETAPEWLNPTPQVERRYSDVEEAHCAGKAISKKVSSVGFNDCLLSAWKCKWSSVWFRTVG